MDEQSGDVDHTLQEMHCNIQRKRYALGILDAEHSKMCSRIESNMKCIEELANKIYTLEECRLEEYEKKEKEWEEEANTLKMNVNDLKLLFEDEKRQAETDDALFDETIVNLVEERRKDRELYDSRANREQTENLQESHSTISQEISDVKKALGEIKLSFPSLPSPETQFIIENTNLERYLMPEIKQMDVLKSKQLNDLNCLKKNISTLENEVQALSKQL